MAWDFRPGMRVVCINGVEPGHGVNVWNTTPVLGKIYTIRKVVSAETLRVSDGLFLLLEEIVNPTLPTVYGDKREVPFHALRFRPLDERRIDCFRAHLAPRNVEVVA